MSLPIWTTTPGSLGTVQEGDPFSFQLIYSNIDGPYLISGSLPDGLTLSPTGLISGTISNIPVDATYEFVLRLTNIDGDIDSHFNISVTDIVPIWPQLSNLGSFKYYSLYENQFFVVDPGGIVQTFTKISGALPPGLELHSNGKLDGIVDLILANTTYNFTIRAQLDGTKFIDKAFSLTITIAGNSPPLWNDPAGLISHITNGIPFSFQFSAGDPELSPVTYTAINLPPGYTVSLSGLLSGTLPINTLPTIYSFSVTISDGFTLVSRTFTLNANQEVIFPILWITPSGSIGEIKEGDKSLLGVKAESTSLWLRYELTAGSLPNGLTLDVNTGDIWGMAEEQILVDQVFNFTIRAYNLDAEEFRNFSITLIQAYDTGATKIEAALYGNDRLLWLDLFTSEEIGHEDIFREGDAQYGLVDKPRILIVENLDNPSPDDIFLALQDVRRGYLTLGKVEVAKAVYDNQFTYEVLYRKVYDDAEGIELEFIHPQTSQLVKPGSIKNLRTRLLDLGSSGGNDNIQLYMKSEQTIGTPSSTLGYFVHIPFAHVKPGTGQAIADKINANDIQTKKLYSRRVRVDRIIMSPAASTDFNPQFILFDTLV